MNNLKDNFLLKVDNYKQSHWKMYPDNTKVIYSYLESRGGIYPKTVFFGLQYYLKEYLEGVVVTQEMIDRADKILTKTFGASFFNRQGWQYIVDNHNGQLPVRIKAVREGSVVETGNVLLTIENTDPNCAFLTNFLETLIMKVFYPITVATNSYMIKQVEKKYAELCGVQENPFFLNDFGYRGVSSEESAGIGGMSHLINYAGSCTARGSLFAMEYYNSDVCGFSVPAAEHSTITIYGKENEAKAYERFIEQYPTGILSVVSDSYDLYNAIENIYGKTLKDKILARDGIFVVRPDSGYPPEVCLKSLNLLWDAFGGSTNDKGFKVINPKVKVLYGDGICYMMIEEILKTITDAGYSIENVIFGQGGALLQKCDRDTFKFALKCSAALVDDRWVDVYKQPKTDSGKNSKKGRLALIKKDGKYITVPENSVNEEENELITVFENGKITKEYTFDEIKENIK